MLRIALEAFGDDGGEPLEMVFPLKGADGRFRPFLTRNLRLRRFDREFARLFVERRRHREHAAG